MKADKEIAEGLGRCLAESYLLYLKTQNFHWNVTGPMFHSLHKMFEEQYLDLAQAVDLIAERIRALGHYAPATFVEFSKLSKITEETGVPAADEMIQLLYDGNEQVVRSCHRVMELGEADGDGPTVDLMNQRMSQHQKNAWMLRSHIQTPKGQVFLAG
jgi:starvation-inducible DNA-binding protein